MSFNHSNTRAQTEMLYFTLILTFSFSNALEPMQFAHHVTRHDDYELFWTPGEEDIIFEIQVYC